jgi:chemotaxis signal transduction protein
MTSRSAMVHVHDPRVRWAVPASQVVRIVAATEWLAAPAIDVFAALGPAPDAAAHRVLVVRGAGDRETALLATGVIHISDVEQADVLPLPEALAVATPEISAIILAHDASLSLLLQPSAVSASDDSALREEPCPSRS